MNYRLLIDYEVIEFLEKLPRMDRQLLRNRFVAIRNDPQKFSDYVESHSTSHRLDIHICGKFAIQYWQDHADRHIKILDIDIADLRNR